MTSCQFGSCKYWYGFTKIGKSSGVVTQKITTEKYNSVFLMEKVMQGSKKNICKIHIKNSI